MTKPRRIALVSALAFVAVAVAIVAVRSRGRVYQGRTESAWIAGLGKDLDATAIQQWRALGQDAVPILTKALGEGNSLVDRTYRRVWPRFPVAMKKRLQKPRDLSKVHNNAAILLLGLGKDAMPAAPALARVLADPNPDTRRNAAACLDGLVPAMGREKRDLLPALLPAMQDDEVAVRELVAHMLGCYPEDAREVIPVLVMALTNNHQFVRARVTTSLGKMDFTKAGPEVPPLLVRTLSYPEPQVRVVAATKLGAMKQQPELAVPALVALLGDPAPVVRHAAASALGKFGADARSAVPALLKAMEAEEPLVRNSASNAVREIDPQASPKALTNGAGGRI